MRNAKIIVAINTLIICIAAIAILWLSKVEEKPELPAHVHDGFCYWKTLDAEDSIAESKPGVYEYQIYATARGVEVWKRCE